jgi:hypothetical protein
MKNLTNCGIYKIQNTENFKLYIGSAKNFKDRFRRHKASLVGSRHINKHLQAAWNKYGEENFIFQPLFECSKEELLNWEQYFLDIYNPEYNICKKAGNTLGYKHTEEYLNSRRKSFILISPNGKILNFRGTADCARKLGLKSRYIGSLLSGKRRQVSGYTANFLDYLVLKNFGDFRAYNLLKDKVFEIENLKTGEKQVVYSPTVTAKKLDLHAPNLIALRDGLYSQTKGWVLTSLSFSELEKRDNKYKGFEKFDQC